MHTRPLRWIWPACIAMVAMAQVQAQTPPEPAATMHGQTYAPELVWSLGWRLKMNDMREPGQLGLHPMIGLRYGRWRTGAVDADSWHRFGQVRTDNTLTYDWLDSRQWRTSLSASIINFQRDSTFDALEPGRKTLRGRATIDYIGWPRWSAGLAVTQDLLGRGAGTTLSPSLTYRQPLGEDSTILLSQFLTWSRSDLWRYRSAAGAAAIDPHQDSRWGMSLETSLTLRQRWKPQWSWYAQIGRSQLLKAGDPLAQQGQTLWSGQIGMIYFQR